MKFSNDNEVFDLIRANPNKAKIDAYRKEAKELRMLVQGIGLEAMLETMPEFEREDMAKIRRRLTRSVVDLFERVLVQRNKIFSAKGGSRTYDMPESQNTQFRNILNDVRKGMSIQKWVQSVALPAFDTDPMSVVFMEVNPQTSIPYPTYKSTDNIFDYRHDGRRVDYIIFSFSQEEINNLVKLSYITADDKHHKFYRVVDDAQDRIVMYDGRDFTIKKAFVNYFGIVPALICSDEYIFNLDSFASNVYKIKELSREFLTDGSTKVVAKKYQMFPKEWGVRIKCMKCEGTGQHEGEDCNVCKGTGQMNNVQVAQRIGVPVMEDGKANGPIPPGGYYVPPIDSWNAMNAELDRLEKYMNQTYWGAVSASQTNGLTMGGSGAVPDQATATNSLLNEQPKNEKLRTLSKWAQSTEKFITDHMGKFLYPTSYKGSTVIYGDRYLLESPDELMEYYEGLRAKGAPVPALNSALIDVYEAKYSGNPVELRKHTVLMYVEPFVHQNVATVMGWPVPEKTKLSKLYFSEWLQTISDMEIITTKEDALRAKLEQYAMQFKIEQPEQEKQPITV